MIVYIIWLLGVIVWNFLVPGASPIEDVIVAVLLSFLSIGLKKKEKITLKETKIEEPKKENDLGDGLKRLMKMYNDGHLSKVEFEKAKNKLLK